MKVLRLADFPLEQSVTRRDHSAGIVQDGESNDFGNVRFDFGYRLTAFNRPRHYLTVFIAGEDLPIIGKERESRNVGIVSFEQAHLLASRWIPQEDAGI